MFKINDSSIRRARDRPQHFSNPITIAWKYLFAGKSATTPRVDFNAQQITGEISAQKKKNTNAVVVHVTLCAKFGKLFRRSQNLNHVILRHSKPQQAQPLTGQNLKQTLPASLTRITPNS